MLITLRILLLVVYHDNIICIHIVSMVFRIESSRPAAQLPPRVIDASITLVLWSHLTTIELYC